MLLWRTISFVQLLLLLLVLKHEIPQTSAVNLSQLKGQQQQSLQQQQQQQHQQHTQQQQQHVHQQTVAQQQQPQQQHQPSSHIQQAQYVHEKDTMHEALKHVNSEEDITDPYQILNELKHEPHLPSSQFSWNPYSLPSPPFPQQQQQHLSLSQFPNNAHLPFEGLGSTMATPKFLPFFGYPQPVFIPYPLYIAPPEMFYPNFAPNVGASNDIDESMSRAANSARRPSSSAYPRNSPIYYVRLPPTPYMFLPGLGYTAQSSPASSSFGGGFSPMLPYPSMPAFSAFSSIFNLPVNFLANGKPTNIYQMGGSPNDLQSPFAGLNNGFGSRPPPPNPYRPMSGSTGGNYLSSLASSSSSYGISAPPPQQQQQLQDSKMTSLKRPFIFNGRPEEIYILPNNFNPLNTDSGYY